MATTKSNTVLRKIDGKFQFIPSEIPPLGPTQVLIRITHSGLCHTDLFYLDSGMALGHEGVGIVEEVGSSVTNFKVGDRAGGGYLRNSCGKCTYCLTGREIWCLNRDIYGETSFSTGTFSTYYIGEETFVYPIPSGMSSSHAAPLQCAGATVYAGLTATAKPGDRVGVVGIGGLGHLAVQFAAKLGAEVVVFSTSNEKEKEAREWGATEFCLLDQVGESSLKEPVDVLVLTGSKYPHFNKFLNPTLLSRTGTILPLTASPNEMSFPALKMFFNGYNVHSSLVADRKVHADMLRFADRHGIKPVVEEFGLDEKGFGDAVKKLAGGGMRYRGVLVVGGGV